MSIPNGRMLPQVRDYFGFSQEELAQLLGVSRTLISMAEIGRRPLPAELWALVQPLVEALESAEDAAQAPLPLLVEERRPVWRRQQQCLRQVETLRQLLSRMQSLAGQMQRKQAVLPAVQAATPSGPEAERVQQWAQWQQTEVRATLRANGSGAQALLLSRIAGLEAEAAALGQWVAGSMAAPDASAGSGA